LPSFYERPAHHKRTYDVIHRACERLKEYYFEPRDNWLPNLEFARDSVRQTRRERREAIATVAQVMLNHMDMASLNIAFWKKEHYYPISVELLAKLAKLNRRRCERALNDLKRAGYLTFDYRVKTLADGSLQPMVALKKVAKLFFYHLGITFDKLKQCQTYAQKKFAKLSKKARMKAAESRDKLAQFFKQKGRANKPHHILRGHTRQPSKPPDRGRQARVARERQRSELYYLLTEQHPDWSFDQYRQEIERLQA
jgi:hypothetical protein